MKEKYHTIRKISENIGINWTILIKESTEVKKSQISSDVPYTHIFEFPKNTKSDMTYEMLAAKAKVNEIASLDLENIQIKTINPILGKQKILFGLLMNILSTYWAFNEMGKFVDMEIVEKEIEGLSKVIGNTKHPFDEIIIHALYEKYDLSNSEVAADKMSRKILDSLKKYGHKEPCIQYAAQFFNSLHLQSEAVVVDKSTVLLTLPGPANRF